jgi:hypothetical protein
MKMKFEGLLEVSEQILENSRVNDPKEYLFIKEYVSGIKVLRDTVDSVKSQGESTLSLIEPLGRIKKFL